MSVGASLPRNFQRNVLCHLTCILLHGRISKIRPRHDIRKDAGYNHDRGQWVPIGYARPASGGQKGPCITWHDPLGCLGGFMPCLTAPRVRTKVRRTHTHGVLYTSFILCQQSRVKRDTAIRLSRLLYCPMSWKSSGPPLMPHPRPLAEPKTHFGLPTKRR